MDTFSVLIANLNQSSYFSGLMMILLNIGGKYVSMEITDIQEQFLSHIIIRRILAFTIFFTATRDIYKSCVMTAVFIILVSGLFNEKSKYCILPKHMIYSPKEGRTISNDEIEYANKILRLSKEQQQEKKKHLDSLKSKKEKDKNVYQKNLNILKL